MMKECIYVHYLMLASLYTFLLSIVNSVQQQVRVVSLAPHSQKQGQAFFSQAKTPFGSLFLPSDTESLHEFGSPIDTSRLELNNFLASRDKSPIRSSLSTPWDDAGERTKRYYYYVQKATEVVAESLKVIMILINYGRRWSLHEP